MTSTSIYGLLFNVHTAHGTSAKLATFCPVRLALCKRTTLVAFRCLSMGIIVTPRHQFPYITINSVTASSSLFLIFFDLRMRIPLHLSIVMSFPHTLEEREEE